MACCKDCEGLGDLDTLAQKPAVRLAALGAAVLLGIGALVYFVPEKRRTRRRFSDPGIRHTRRLTVPSESMGQVVWERRT